MADLTSSWSQRGRELRAVRVRGVSCERGCIGVELAAGGSVSVGLYFYDNVALFVAVALNFQADEA